MDGMVAEIDMDNKRIGPGHPVFIIAEAGVNHNGELELAKKMIDEAKEAGADAIKFQTFKAERLVTQDTDKALYQKESAQSNETQYEMLKRLELSENAHRVLFDYASKKDIIFLSTPFDEVSADFLENLGVAAFKVSSTDLTNVPFLIYLAGKRLPILLSTGMSGLQEIADSVNAIKETGNNRIVLFQCTSNYPTKPEDANLKVINTLADNFALNVGFSDHTIGPYAAVLAVALGASVIEKHFTLNKNLSGPDHKMSAEPAEFNEMVRMIRLSEKLLGSEEKFISAKEKKVAAVARKSLVAKKAIKAGTKITAEMISVKRPGTGIKPANLYDIIGKIAAQDIEANQVLSNNDIRSEK